MKITVSSKIEELLEDIFDIDNEEAYKALKKITVADPSDDLDAFEWFVRQVPKLSVSGNYYYAFYDDCMFLFEGDYKDICKKLRKATKEISDKLFCPDCGCERDECECDLCDECGEDKSGCSCEEIQEDNLLDEDCTHDGCKQLKLNYCPHCGEKL